VLILDSAQALRNQILSGHFVHLTYSSGRFGGFFFLLTIIQRFSQRILRIWVWTSQRALQL
jgi:hypothetical protein